MVIIRNNYVYIASKDKEWKCENINGCNYWDKLQFSIAFERIVLLWTFAAAVNSRVSFTLLQCARENKDITVPPACMESYGRSRCCSLELSFRHLLNFHSDYEWRTPFFRNSLFFFFLPLFIFLLLVLSANARINIGFYLGNIKFPIFDQKIPNISTI